MSTVEEIEKAISTLSREELFRLREFLRHRFEEEWDREFEADVRSGKLDSLAQQALVEHFSGQSTPLPLSEEPSHP